MLSCASKRGVDATLCTPTRAGFPPAEPSRNSGREYRHVEESIFLPEEGELSRAVGGLVLGSMGRTPGSWILVHGSNAVRALKGP